MAQELQSGSAVFWGIGGADGQNKVQISAFASFLLDSAKGVHKFKLTAIEDETEFDANLTATNAMKELDLTLTPSGATRAAALGVTLYLKPLTVLTLTNFKIAEYNDKWIYIGDQSIDLTHGAAKITLKIRKYDDATQNTLLTTPVTG